MSDQPEIVRFDEPFKPIDIETDTGSSKLSGNSAAGGGIVVPHRRVIKTKSGAPHLVVAIPIGGREQQDVAKCEHCSKPTRFDPENSYRAPGMVPAELLANFTNMMQPLGCTVSFMYLKNNLSAVLREAMTQEALKMNADYIFFWDDDTILPGDTWYKMLAKMKMFPDIGAITGVYFTKMDPPEPVLYKDAGKGAYWGFNLDPNAEPEDVLAAGAGCLMVRMEAIRRMEAPYWSDERSTNSEGTLQHISGHDIRFCRKLAAESGYRMTVDGSIQCVHIDVASQRAFRLPANSPPMVRAREMADGYSGIPGAEPEKGRMPELLMSSQDIQDLFVESRNGEPVPQE